jgi:hypothetical protein
VVNVLNLALKNMSDYSISRRVALKRGAIALFSLTAIPILALPRTAHAVLASKAEFNYQDQPHAGQRCAECSAFLPPTQSNSAEGACKIVAGPISPQGWCMAFSQKT